MVMGVKRGTYSEADYRRDYRNLLDYWWFHDPLFWDEFLALPEVALGRYCPNGNFCHRYLLVEFLREVTDVDYRGEIPSSH